MKTDTGFSQMVDIVASRAGFDLHSVIPEAAVSIETGTGLALYNAVRFLWVVAIQPDGGMGATVVLLDAECGHGISSHACEAVPLPIHMTVTGRLTIF